MKHQTFKKSIFIWNGYNFTAPKTPGILHEWQRGEGHDDVLTPSHSSMRIHCNVTSSTYVHRRMSPPPAVSFRTRKQQQSLLNVTMKVQIYSKVRAEFFLSWICAYINNTTQKQQGRLPCSHPWKTGGTETQRNTNMAAQRERSQKIQGDLQEALICYTTRGGCLKQWRKPQKRLCDGSFTNKEVRTPTKIHYCSDIDDNEK